VVRIHRTTDITALASGRLERRSQGWVTLAIVESRGSPASDCRFWMCCVLPHDSRPIHGLLEVDVTGVPARQAAAEGSPTMTTFVVATLARAVRDCPEVNVRRAGWKVVWFDAVDIAVTVERLVADAILPIPFPCLRGGQQEHRCDYVGAAGGAERSR
jgi:hypothetical protein